MMGRFLYILQLKLHKKVIPCITVHQEDMLVAGKNLKSTYAEIFYGICTGIDFGSRHALSYLAFSTSGPCPFSRISSSGMTFVKFQSRVSIYSIPSKELIKNWKLQDLLRNGFTCFLLICFFFLIKILLSFL